jgi:hypothetical protein
MTGGRADDSNKFQQAAMTLQQKYNSQGGNYHEASCTVKLQKPLVAYNPACSVRDATS